MSERKSNYFVGMLNSALEETGLVPQLRQKVNEMQDFKSYCNLILKMIVATNVILFLHCHLLKEQTIEKRKVGIKTKQIDKKTRKKERKKERKRK